MKQVAIFHLLITIFSATTAATGLPTIFVFGDSISDDGNNNFLSDAPKANYHPYGIDYPGGIPTGRFSNGFIGIDYIAKAIGHKASPPPFLAINDHFKLKKLRGVNFASSGSGILDTTGKDVITMSKQIVDFQSVVGNITSQVEKLSADLFLAKSLLFFSVGSNDLVAEFTLSDPKNDSQRDEIITPIINTFKDQLMMLYKLGARKFAVVGTSPIGCGPGARNPNPPNDCNKDLNALSLRFKDATKVLLQHLSSNLAGFEYSFGDSYELISRIRSNASRFGFTEMKAACCRSLTATVLCSPNSTYCSNREEYFFWDAVHPTQAAYKIIAHELVYGSLNSPINIRQLVFSLKH